jgi:hypothetical protein
MTIRHRLPNRRASERFEFVHEGDFYLATVSFRDGQPAELFLDCKKPGSALAAQAKDAAVLCSLLLQHGVAPETIRHSINGPIATALAKIGGAP